MKDDSFLDVQSPVGHTQRKLVRALVDRDVVKSRLRQSTLVPGGIDGAMQRNFCLIDHPVALNFELLFWAVKTCGYHGPNSVGLHGT